MEDMLITIAAILGVSFLFSELFYRIKYPRVIGQIIAGVILGMPLFSRFFGSHIEQDIYFLSELGIIFLLLLTGLEINLEKFKKAEKDSIMVAVFCVLLPFTLGFLVIKLLGHTNMVAFIVGAALSLTAEGTTLKVLLDMRALNTKVGTVMFGAGIFDDILGILFLSIISFEISRNIADVILFPIKILIFVAIVYLTYKYFPMGLRKIEKEHSTISTFSFILLFGICVAVVSKLLSVGPIVGAFIAGIIIHLSEHNKTEHKENVKELEIMTFSLIIPFFFIYIGLQFQKAIPLMMNHLFTAVIILIIATVGKIAGALIAKPFTTLSYAQAHLVGWGMNSRGLIEMVVAGLAYDNNLIPAHIFGSIIAAAIITTILFPIMMKVLVKKNRKILKA